MKDKRAYRPNATAVCAAALRRGALVKAGEYWRFGPRVFGSRTVNALINSGDAIRVDDRVIALACLTEALNADPS